MPQGDKSTIVSRAPVVAEVAARHAEEAETARRLSPEVVRAVLDAGFARHFVPVAHGGEAGGFAELTAAVGLVGEGCTSAGWAASLAAYAGRYAAFLPRRGRRRSGRTGRTRCWPARSCRPARRSPVAGAGLLSGEWKYISGVHFADWALACAAVPAEGPQDPDVRPEVRFFAVPRADFTIEDSWFTVGMRGTGSDTLVLADAFVPEHRTLAARRCTPAAHPPRTPAATSCRCTR